MGVCSGKANRAEFAIIKCIVCESVIDHAEVFCYKCGVALRQPI